MQVFREGAIPFCRPPTKSLKNPTLYFSTLQVFSFGFLFKTRPRIKQLFFVRRWYCDCLCVILNCISLRLSFILIILLSFRFNFFFFRPCASGRRRTSLWEEPHLPSDFYFPDGKELYSAFKEPPTPPRAKTQSPEKHGTLPRALPPLQLFSKDQPT